MADVIIQATYKPQIEIIQDIDLGIDGLELQRTTQRIAYATSLLGTMSPSTTPISVTKVWTDTQSLIAGAATINLTSLARGNLPSVDLTGLTVKFILIYNYATNTSTLRVQDGSANPYFIFGASTGDITMPIGWFQFFGVHNTTGAGALAAVSSTVKNIDLSSTDSDATFDILIAA